MSPMNDDRLAELLGDDLHRQVSGMHDAPLTLGDVRGRAGRIRRNRRLAAGAGVVAALAVIAPTALLVGGNGPQSKSPEPVSPTQVVDRAPVRTTLTLDGLSRGDDPEVEYFTPEGVVLPGRGLVETDESWQALVSSRADGGWLAVSPSGDDVRYLDEDLVAGDTAPVNQDLVTSADRSHVAWTSSDRDSQTLLLHSTTDAGAEWSSWEFDGLPLVQAVGVLGDDRVVFHVMDGGEITGVRVAEADGTTEPILGALAAEGASPDGERVAVRTDGGTETEPCYAVLDMTTAAHDAAWETCDTAVRSFSPDGRHVFGGVPYRSGAGDTFLVVRDARSGEVVATFDQPRNGQLILGQTVWESDDTILAIASEGARQTILRLGLDGSMEAAADFEDGAIFEDQPWVFGSDRY